MYLLANAFYYNKDLLEVRLVNYVMPVVKSSHAG